MENKMKKFIPLFIFAGLVLVGIGIYIVVTQLGMASRVDSSLKPAGFWLGIWQGIIICLTFIASWFDHDIVLYQVKNNGFWYNFGFIIGLTIAIGGSAGGSRGKKGKSKKTNLECK